MKVRKTVSFFADEFMIQCVIKSFALVMGKAKKSPINPHFSLLEHRKCVIL